MKKTPKLDQFYADFFLRIAKRMVTRPKDLEAGVSIVPGESDLPRFLVTAQCHAQDYGIVMGGNANHVRAFKVLLRAASTKRSEFCDLLLDDPFGTKTAYKPTPLDPSWDGAKDKEIGELVWAICDDCWTGIIDTVAKSEGGRTVVTIATEKGIAEEELIALQTLMKALGRTAGRGVDLKVA